MSLPVGGIDTRIGDRGPTVDHHSPAHIDTYMGNARRVIGADEKNQISGLRLGGRYRSADVVKPLGAQPPHAPSRMIDDPGHEPGAVKGCAR